MTSWAVRSALVKRAFLDHTGADAIYILGSPWDALGMIATLEQDLVVPVVEPVAARIWEIQRRLHVRQPIKGYGILLETLLWLWTQIGIRAPSHGPNGGVADTLDEAKAAFRRTWNGYGAFESACGRSPRSNEELHEWLERRGGR